MNVFMFSGQGAQYFQMGQSLFQKEGAFRQELLRLDKIFQAESGRSVLDYIYGVGRSKSDVFDNISYSHPALFVIQYALARELMSRGVICDKVFGSSLGEFVACSVAGYVDPADGLKSIIRQTQILEACQITGGMIAVIDRLESYDILKSLCCNIELSGVNFQGNYVIAGLPIALKIAVNYLKEKRISHVVLPVNYPFHTHWMDPIKPAYETVWASMAFNDASTMPWYSCSSKLRVSGCIKDHFWQLLRQPLYFEETLAQVERDGAHNYIDLSPTSSFVALMRMTSPLQEGSAAYPLLNPFGGEQINLDAIITNLAINIAY